MLFAKLGVLNELPCRERAPAVHAGFMHEFAKEGSTANHSSPSFAFAPLRDLIHHLACTDPHLNDGNVSALHRSNLNQLRTLRRL